MYGQGRRASPRRPAPKQCPCISGTRRRNEAIAKERTVKGNCQVVPAGNGGGKPGRGRGLLGPRFSRRLRQLAAAGSGLALLSMMVLSPVVVTPASAQRRTLGTPTPAAGPPGRRRHARRQLPPRTSAPWPKRWRRRRPATLSTWPPRAGTGTGEADYVGNWTVSTSGTSASAPLTIEPASGVANPTLDGNGGSSSSPCSTLRLQRAGPHDQQLGLRRHRRGDVPKRRQHIGSSVRRRHPK